MPKSLQLKCDEKISVVDFIKLLLKEHEDEMQCNSKSILV